MTDRYKDINEDAAFNKEELCKDIVGCELLSVLLAKEEDPL